MKKYKLIQEYPGSPTLGTIIEKACYLGSGSSSYNKKLYTNKKSPQSDN